MLFHRNGTHQYEVAAIAPPHRLRLFAQHPDLSYELDHLIDAVHGGGSRLTLAFRSRPETTTGQSLEPLISPLIWMILRDDLEQDLFRFRCGDCAGTRGDFSEDRPCRQLIER
jgi:hypothetical protein